MHTKGNAMKPIESFETSEATQKTADVLMSLYEEGKIFDGWDVRKTCEVHEAATAFADAFGEDIARAAGEKASGPAAYSILHNLRVEVEMHIRDGHCAVGVMDYDQRVSYYIGLRRCKLWW